MIMIFMCFVLLCESSRVMIWVDCGDGDNGGRP